MGVTYKLKPEIIEEIVKRKRENPSISCRQLAEEVASLFNVKISKSSVNTVLKKSQLSSSVGRRSKVEYPAKKFEIPSERKKQLLENVEKTGLAIDIGTSKEANKASRREKKPKPAPIIETAELPKEKLQNDMIHKKEDIQKISHKKPVEEKTKVSGSSSDQQITNIRERRKSGWGETYDGMGFFLVKAAFGELNGNLKAMEFLERVLGGNLDEQTKLACEILIDFWILGLKAPEQIRSQEKHAIWDFYGATKDLVMPIVEGLIKKFKKEKISAETYWRFVRDFEREFIGVKEVKVVFTDQSSYLCDGELSGIFLTEPINYKTVLIGKTMSIVSGELISNASPLCLHPIINDSNNLDKIYRWLQALNGKEGVKIARVEIHDRNDGILASFSIIPHKRRDFIISAEPNNPDFERWTKSAKWAVKEPYYDVCRDNILYICETLYDDSTKGLPLKGMEIRAISVYSDQNSDPQVVFLSNSETLRNEEIVQKYMERYPQIRFSSENNTKVTNFDQRISENKDENPTFPYLLSDLDTVNKQFYVSDVFDTLFHQVKEWFLQNQFGDRINKNSVSDFLSSICDVSGQMQDLDGLRLIKLIPPENFSCQEIISPLTKVLGQRIISQNFRQKVVFEYLK